MLLMRHSISPIYFATSSSYGGGCNIYIAYFSPYWCPFCYLIELLKDSVSSILVDDSFTCLPSSAAQNANTTATQLLLWCDVNDNASALDTFAADVWTLFNDVVNSAIDSADMLVSKLNKENLWKSFHTLRTSESYETKWIVFLKVSTTVTPCPIFYQYVSDYFFKLHLKSNPGSYAITAVPAPIC